MLDRIPTISVIICAYTEKRWDDLVAAVRSVQRQSLPASEIILVIDHNTVLFERVKAQIPGVIHTENAEHQGLSGARNSGVAVSQGELIAFLDDDAIADPRWLELMGKCCQDPQVLGAGGSVVPLWSGKPPTWFPREFYWVIGCSYQDFEGKVVKVRNAYGGNICIRREVFDTIGGFRYGMGRSEEIPLPLGGEETEFCIRATQHWPERFFLCDFNAISEHHIPLQRMNRRYFRSRCYAEGLSKATMALYTSVKGSLAVERSYTLHLLPRGIMRGIRDGLRGDLAGFARSWMILVGLTTTAAGYLIGVMANRSRSRTGRSADTRGSSAFVGAKGEKV